MSVDRSQSLQRAIRVRRAVEADLAALVALENRTFSSERIAARQWRRYLASPTVAVLIASRSNRMIGACVVFFRAGSNIARLYSMAVADEARESGIGTSLLAAVERSVRRRRANRIVLEVRSDNGAARRLYERHGYQRFAVERGYYEDGHDAERYGKDLSSVAR